MGFTLIVVLSSRTEAPTAAVLLEDTRSPVQTFGLAVASPGRYKTAAGKGYDLGPDNRDPPELVLTLPALDFVQFEAANVFWYWDRATKRFHSISMSD